MNFIKSYWDWAAVLLLMVLILNGNLWFRCLDRLCAVAFQWSFQ